MAVLLNRRRSSLGRAWASSINGLDRPVIVAYLLIIVFHLLVDLLYSVLDPRVRLGETRA
jgi:peptide/nickel transport system permease protein